MFNFRRITTAAALATAGVLALAGCGATGPAAPETNGARPSSVSSFDVNLDDGRTVLCIFAKEGRGGGLSCDWAGAR